ncbi:MAG: hypothetical protein COS34_01880 [Lysobacterales bacterium CG02_land_8_20_14_3_00_62_12]|nr:MAG: hypothetical protein COS34_01880 [Xanthomonadales bacterium CG02_land_8_20_14_3_00_62_12]
MKRPWLGSKLASKDERFLTPAAESDFEEAAEFYERTGSPALAAKFVAEFRRVSQLLLEFPGIGSP